MVACGLMAILYTTLSNAGDSLALIYKSRKTMHEEQLLHTVSVTVIKILNQKWINFEYFKMFTSICI